MVITVLSGYVAFSGLRVLQSKTNTPKLLDILVATGSLAVLAYFLYYLKAIGMMWALVVMYTTVGALVLVVGYDFLRYLIPQERYREHRIWLYEHIYKMTSAFGALLSAFSGTVFPEHHPHSQYLPSIFVLLTILGFMAYTYRNRSSA